METEWFLKNRKVLKKPNGGHNENDNDNENENVAIGIRMYTTVYDRIRMIRMYTIMRMIMKMRMRM